MSKDILITDFNVSNMLLCWLNLTIFPNRLVVSSLSKLIQNIFFLNRSLYFAPFQTCKDIQINLCEPLKYVGCKFFKNIGTYTAYTNNTLSQQEHE